MTVIFHALLTPTFNINFQQGDKVVLRGGSPFSWNQQGQQVEMHPVRHVFFSYFFYIIEWQIIQVKNFGIIFPL